MNENDFLRVVSELGVNLVHLTEYYPRIGLPLGKPSNLKFNSREFSYWIEKGAITVPQLEKGQSPWFRLNLYQLLWIKIVFELREFNIPFAPISKLNKEMFESQFDALKKNRKKVYDSIKTKKISADLLNTMDFNNLNESEIQKKYGISFNLICSIVADILILKRNVKLIVYKEVDEFCFSLSGYSFEHLNSKKIDLEKGKSYLIIDLRKLIEEYLLDPDLESLNADFDLILREELDLLKLIRDKQVKEINIKKDDNGDFNCVATSKNEIKDDNVLMIKKLLRMNEFNDVRVVLRNDKHIYIENRKKIKIRPGKTAQ